MKTVILAMLLFAACLTAPARAYADCGSSGQLNCTQPVPTVDQVLEDLAGLTNPDIPAANKTNVVSPGFSPEQAGAIDDHLRRMNAGGMLPLPFDVTNIQPAPDNFAGATVAIPIGFHSTSPGPIVLVEHGGHWLITQDTAWTLMDAIWYNANRQIIVTPHF